MGLAVVLLVVLVGLIVFLGASFLYIAYAPASDADLAALHVLTGVPGGSPRVDRLFAAYLSRTRRYRTSWSVVAWMSALVLAVGLAVESGDIGSNDPTWLMVLVGFSGYLLGAIVAELHHLRRPKHGTRTASLTPRSLRDYMRPKQRWFLHSLALLAIALAVVGFVAHTTGSDVYHAFGNDDRFPIRHAETFWLPLAVLGVVAAVLWLVIAVVQRAIVQRPRPALPDDLAAGDDAIRKASLSTVALGGSGLLAVIGSAEAAILGRNIMGVASLLCAVATLALFFLSIHLMFRTRRVAWPQRKLEKDRGIW